MFTTLAEGLRFPEGPVAMPDGSVTLVEIAAGRVSRVGADGARTTIAETDGGPNGLAAGPGGSLVLCNNGGFRWVEEWGVLRPAGQAEDYAHGRVEVIEPGGAVRTLYTECDGRPLKGPNDLVLDGKGGFWFTDLGKSRARDRDHGGVYWAALDGSRIVEVAYPVPGGANGIGLSPDGETLYVAETETGRLWRFDVLGPGRLRGFAVLGPGRLRKSPWPSPHGGELVCQFPGFRRLDSLKVAASGNVVVATLVSGEVTTVSPGGEILSAVRFPDKMVTNVAFGGEGLRTLFVTLSSTGKLVSMPWPEPGLRLAFQ